MPVKADVSVSQYRAEYAAGAVRAPPINGLQHANADRRQVIRLNPVSFMQHLGPFCGPGCADLQPTRFYSGGIALAINHLPQLNEHWHRLCV